MSLSAAVATVGGEPVPRRDDVAPGARLAARTISARSDANGSGITFETAMPVGTQIPGVDPRTFTHVEFSNGGTTLAFCGWDGGVPHGVYEAAQGAVSVIADRQTTVPGQPFPFPGFGGQAAASGENVAFVGYGTDFTTSTPIHGVYARLDGQLKKIVAYGDALPRAGGVWGTTTFGTGYYAAISGSQIALGADSGGVYLWSDDGLAVVADQLTALPGFGEDRLWTPGHVAVSGSTVAFAAYANDFRTPAFGVYLWTPGGTIQKVLDSETAMPGSQEPFAQLLSLSLSADKFAVVATSFDVSVWGVYSNVGGTLAKIADLTTPLPDGPGTYRGFEAASIDGENVAFNAGTEVNSSGVFLASGQTITRIVSYGDSVNGVTIGHPLISTTALKGSRLAFVTYMPGTAIFIANLDDGGPPEPCALTAIGRAAKRTFTDALPKWLRRSALGRSLSAARAFRDEVLLASPEGRQLVADYYRHSPELTSLILSRPALLSQSMQLVDELAPALASAHADGSTLLSTAQWRRGLSLADQLETDATPELRESLDRMRRYLTARHANSGSFIRLNWRNGPEHAAACPPAADSEAALTRGVPGHSSRSIGGPADENAVALTRDVILPE